MLLKFFGAQTRTLNLLESKPISAQLDFSILIPSPFPGKKTFSKPYYLAKIQYTRQDTQQYLIQALLPLTLQVLPHSFLFMKPKKVRRVLKKGTEGPYSTTVTRNITY